MDVDTAAVTHLAAQGLTQREIARRLGCSQATVSRALAAEPPASTPAPWTSPAALVDHAEDHAEGADLAAANRQLIDARARELAAEMIHDGTGEAAFLMNTRMGLAAVEHQAQAKAARLVEAERSQELIAAVRAQTQQSTQRALEVAQRPRVPRPPQAPLTPARKRLAAGVGAAVAVGGLAVGLGPIGSTWAALLVAGTAVNVGRRGDEPPPEPAPLAPAPLMPGAPTNDAVRPGLPAAGRGGRLGARALPSIGPPPPDVPPPPKPLGYW